MKVENKVVSYIGGENSGNPWWTWFQLEQDLINKGDDYDYSTILGKLIKKLEAFKQNE